MDRPERIKMEWTRLVAASYDAGLSVCVRVSEYGPPCYRFFPLRRDGSIPDYFFSRGVLGTVQGMEAAMAFVQGYSCRG